MHFSASESTVFIQFRYSLKTDGVLQCLNRLSGVEQTNVLSALEGSPKLAKNDHRSTLDSIDRH